MNQIFLYPNWILFIALTLAMVFDFATGFAKAKFLKVNRSSEAFRKTIKKIIQYFSAIIVVVFLINLMRFDKSNEWFNEYSSWLQNGVVILMIYIELISILENAIAVDKSSTFSRVFIIRFHRFLTAQLKDNPMYHYDSDEQKKIEERKLKRQKEIL
ncbi:phage holin family protein [Empedobacter sp.]|uniref:phage holin family protein n=1 Tax=Empedobacter sp. TaxID=1927715 RepID=UPI002897605C|nr:phage holin family protein [Empedobacter sp.]